MPNGLLLISDFTLTEAKLFVHPFVQLSFRHCKTYISFLNWNRLTTRNISECFCLTRLYLFIVILYSINLSLIWDIKYGYSIKKNRILFLPLKKICLVSPCLLFFIPEISYSIPSMDETLINATLSLMWSWEEFWEWSIKILESWLEAYMISWKEWQWQMVTILLDRYCFTILLDRFICLIAFLTMTLI